MQDCFSNLQPECVGFGILTPFPLTFELPLCPQIQVPLPSVHPPPPPAEQFTGSGTQNSRAEGPY